MRSFTFTPASEHDALLALNAVSGLGNRNILKLIAHYGSATKVFEASIDDVCAGLGLSEQVAISLGNFPFASFIEKESKTAKLAGIKIVTIADEDYPLSLHQINDRPIVLYLAGILPEKITHSIAIVGARHATLYGIGLAERFARELSEYEIPIVSGLALGIDAAAHRGCLKAQGRTVAVLGCGVDIVYPRQNRDLFAQIKEHGCLISEFPLGTPPLPYNFPRRNRIVSGITLGTVVVEARVKSGALITAEFAMDQGREVFAVPGRIDNCLSEGPFALIKQGAKLVLKPEDILEELPLSFKRSNRPSQEEKPLGCDLSFDEQAAFDILKEGEMPHEVLEARTGKSSTGLTAALVGLQIKKLVQEMPGKVYRLLNK